MHSKFHYNRFIHFEGKFFVKHRATLMNALNVILKFPIFVATQVFYKSVINFPDISLKYC